MKFIQKTVEDSLISWQNLSSEARDRLVGDVLFPLEYSKNNPPRFSANIKNDTDTDKLLLKLRGLDIGEIKTETLPRSTLSVVRCGDGVIPIMPEHKAIAFIGYCAAKTVSKESD